MIVDIHAYWNEGKMSLSRMVEKMRGEGIGCAILSAPCYQQPEPDKSLFMYAIQRKVLRSNILRPLAELVSRSFYNERQELRSLWRLFTAKFGPMGKTMEPDNRGLLKAVAPYENLLCWYWINPRQMPPLETVQNQLQQPRFVGVKFHAYWHPFTPQEAAPIFSLAASRRMPVYFIMGFGWLNPILEFLKQFPSTPLILGYAGFPYFDQCWRKIKSYPNAFIDFTSDHIEPSAIQEALQVLGVERCLYGSDSPYHFKGADGYFSYKKNLERLNFLNLSVQEEEKLFFGNARKLFKIKYALV